MIATESFSTWTTETKVIYTIRNTAFPDRALQRSAAVLEGRC
jgi:hypothetical protein